MLEFHHFRLYNPGAHLRCAFLHPPFRQVLPQRERYHSPWKIHTPPPLPFLRRCGAAVSLLFFQDVKKSNLPYFRQRLPRGGGREKVEQEDPSAAPSGKKFIFLQRTASSMYTSISPGLFTQSQRPATNPSGRMHTCTYTAPFTVSPSFYLLWNGIENETHTQDLWDAAFFCGKERRKRRKRGPTADSLLPAFCPLFSCLFPLRKVKPSFFFFRKTSLLGHRLGIQQIGKTSMQNISKYQWVAQ